MTEELVKLGTEKKSVVPHGVKEVENRKEIKRYGGEKLKRKKQSKKKTMEKMKKDSIKYINGWKLSRMKDQRTIS